MDAIKFSNVDVPATVKPKDTIPFDCHAYGSNWSMMDLAEKHMCGTVTKMFIKDSFKYVHVYFIDTDEMWTYAPNELLVLNEVTKEWEEDSE